MTCYELLTIREKYDLNTIIFSAQLVTHVVYLYGKYLSRVKLA